MMAVRDSASGSDPAEQVRMKRLTWIVLSAVAVCAAGVARAQIESAGEIWDAVGVQGGLTFKLAAGMKR